MTARPEINSLGSERSLDDEPRLVDDVNDVSSLPCKLCSSSSRDESQSWVVSKWLTAVFGESNEVYYPPCEVQRHITTTSAWLVVGEDIYDVTSYIKLHPGGARSILQRCGGHFDCAKDMQFHSKEARKLWKRFKIGKVRKCGAGVYNTTVGDVQAKEEKNRRREPEKECALTDKSSLQDQHIHTNHFVFLPHFMNEHII